MTQGTVRVAAVQFGVDDNPEHNLKTCLRMIDQAAQKNPVLMVLPEFVNHCSWYRDQEHNYSVAVDIDGPFLREIARKSLEYKAYIVANCTVRRSDKKVTGTNLLFDPNGLLIAESDKQVLMGNENNFLQPATKLGPVVKTSMGLLGMFSCMDGVMYETPRCIALRGAQIMCNTLNSFASDEASLHIPVRAAENKVFVVAANKSGPLVPKEARDLVAKKLRIAPECLNGAGESQIVAPNGTVLEKAPVDGEHIIIADIDVSLADNKLRPDSTNMFSDRRPDLYQPITNKPSSRREASTTRSLEVAVFQPKKTEVGLTSETYAELYNSSQTETELIVLPELPHLPENFTAYNLGEAVNLSNDMIDKLANALGKSSCLICTSVVTCEKKNDYQHVGVVVSKNGIVLKQEQLHSCGRHAWVSTLGNQTAYIDLPWGRLGLVVGGDSIYPETFRLLALQEVDVIAVSTQIQEKWEAEIGLLERAAENRISLIVASTPSDAGTSMVIAPDKDFTLWTEWERPFDGSINQPNIFRANKDSLYMSGLVDPSTAGNRLVTHKTDVVSSRPWSLLGPIIKKYQQDIS